MRTNGRYDLPSRDLPRPKLCSVNDCDRKVSCRGLCGMHYQRWTSHGTTELSPRSGNSGPCSFPGCTDPARQRQLCWAHLAQLRFKGELRPKRGQLPPKLCQFRGCQRKHSRHGWCATHAQQALTGRPMFPIGQRPKKHRILTGHGYVKVYRPDHPNAQKSGWVMEHIAVMSEFLGRGLRPGENVHHINGARDDNRIGNLELWNTCQPKGQRVSDKVEWAIELLRTYRPEALSAT